MNRLRLISLALFLPLLGTAHANADFSGAGQEMELDCDGGVATIQGASNIMHITGACSALVIEGASNKVHVDLAKGARIQVVGADNEVRWTAPEGTKPKLNVVGAANRIARAGK